MFNNGKGRGYYKNSMSTNAVIAYINGEQPMYKWTKKEILKNINEYLEDNEKTIDIDLNKMKKEELINTFLKYTCYHHTGCFKNCTNFYKINKEKIDELSRDLTEEELEEIEKELEKELEKEAQRIKEIEKDDERLDKIIAFRKNHGYEYNSAERYINDNPEKATLRTSKKGNLVYDITLPDGSIQTVLATKIYNTTMYSVDFTI